MDKDTKAIFGLVGGLIVLFLLFITLIRFIVPAIIEAHFYGSLIVSAVVGILGVFGIVYLGIELFHRTIRAFIRN